MSCYPREIAYECCRYLIGEEPLPVRLHWCGRSFLKLVPGNTPPEVWPMVERYQERIRHVLLLDTHEQELLAMDILTEFASMVADREQVGAS